MSDLCLWVEHSQCVFAAVELFNEEQIAKEEKCPNNIYRNYLSYCAKTKRFEGECIISFWQNHEHISKTKAKLQRFCFYCIAISTILKIRMHNRVPIKCQSERYQTLVCYFLFYSTISSPHGLQITGLQKKTLSVSMLPNTMFLFSLYIC